MYMCTCHVSEMTTDADQQVDELRMSVSRAEQQAAWREDHMRQELADMQQVGRKEHE